MIHELIPGFRFPSRNTNHIVSDLIRAFRCLFDYKTFNLNERWQIVDTNLICKLPVQTSRDNFKPTYNI